MPQDQSAVALCTDMWNLVDINISKKDREILRNLAVKVAELAARPVEEEKKKLWYKLNALEPTRPVIFCDPENGWNEIITDDQMQCQGELAQKWEMTLRKEIFWGASMGDDRVIEPYFNVAYVAHNSGWGMEEKKIKVEAEGSYRWEAPLKDFKDMDKLHFPEITVDYERTQKLFDLAKEVFGDILMVRLKGVWWWTLGMTWTLVNLRGLEQIMWDMYDYPRELHQLMAFLRDGHLHMLDFLEENGLLSLNNDGTYVGSGGFGWTRELPQEDFCGQVRTRDMWGFAESQETSQVSPEMFAEFIFPYQLPILERFGLNCYGCCEALNKRWDVVKKAPRLRRVSVSPWADLKDMAEKLGSDYVFSMKPNPAYLAVEKIDVDFIRSSLRGAFKITRNCRVEVIMKDNHTIGHNPENVIKWCRIAREEAENI
ncbi:hypothetical protein SDD30_10120 [Moorella naiadis]|uniref:hypothetical protein n=1 Tax=Moorella naiadis (nom. illeg.) TaxID=3093670 RepID=UPI003D9CAA6B